MLKDFKKYLVVEFVDKEYITFDLFFILSLLLSTLREERFKNNFTKLYNEYGNE